jgi:hypothetical protein
MVGLDGLKLELLQKYREAGVNRLVVPLPEIPKELTRLAATVEQAQKI